MHAMLRDAGLIDISVNAHARIWRYDDRYQGCC
jgi:hypothetical protein